jgi:excisionase family DNA binding protein
VKIPPGILIPAPVCAELGTTILDYLESEYRNSGREMPGPVRVVFAEVAELGLKVRASEQARRAGDVRSHANMEDPRRSPRPLSKAMTYTTAETAAKLGVGCRAVQRRAARQTLPATRTDRSDWRFNARAIDNLVKGSR